MSLRKPAGPSQEGAELGFEPSSIDAEIVLCSPQELHPMAQAPQLQ